MASFDELVKSFRNISKIKLHGGVVGKVSIVVFLFTACITTLAVVANKTEITFLAIIVITLVVFILSLKLILFAEKNPQAALLEGAEFLVHEQIIHGTKDSPTIQVSPGQFVEHTYAPKSESDFMPDSSSQTAIEKSGEK